jgi:hypothetical protein
MPALSAISSIRVHSTRASSYSISPRNSSGSTVSQVLTGSPEHLARMQAAADSKIGTGDRQASGDALASASHRVSRSPPRPAGRPAGRPVTGPHTDGPGASHRVMRSMKASPARVTGTAIALDPCDSPPVIRRPTPGSLRCRRIDGDGRALRGLVPAFAVDSQSLRLRIDRLSGTTSAGSGCKRRRPAPTASASAAGAGVPGLAAPRSIALTTGHACAESSARSAPAGPPHSATTRSRSDILHETPWPQGSGLPACGSATPSGLPMTPAASSTTLDAPRLVRPVLVSLVPPTKLRVPGQLAGGSRVVRRRGVALLDDGLGGGVRRDLGRVAWRPVGRSGTAGGEDRDCARLQDRAGALLTT